MVEGSRAETDFKSNNPRLLRLLKYINNKYYDADKNSCFTSPCAPYLTKTFDEVLHIRPTTNLSANLLLKELEVHMIQAPFDGLPFTLLPFPALLSSLREFHDSRLYIDSVIGGMPIPWRAAHEDACGELERELEDQIRALAPVPVTRRLWPTAKPASPSTELQALTAGLKELKALVSVARAASDSWTYNPAYPWKDNPSEAEEAAWEDMGRIIQTAIWVKPDYFHVFNPYAAWHIIMRKGRPPWWNDQNGDGVLLQALIDETGDIYDELSGRISHRPSVHGSIISNASACPITCDPYNPYATRVKSSQDSTVPTLTAP